MHGVKSASWAARIVQPGNPEFREIELRQLLVVITMAVAGLGVGLAPIDADAKRLGGGKAAGMQRQAPANNTATNTATPATPAAAPTAAAAPAAAAAANAGKRSWLGPIAGLAAGLGLAALFSHLGLGDEFANIVMMVLLALVAFMLVRWLMRRMAGGGARQGAGGMQLAGAGAPAGAAFGREAPTIARESLPTGSGAAATPGGATAATVAAAASPSATLPGGMPAAEFERIAKLVFIRLQAANDAANVEDLRRFTTPELFASLKADLLERGNASQKTDVVQLDARIVETVEEAGQHIVTVRFQGLIREAADAGAEPFDELWHMVRPVDASRDWAIAGIAPTS